MNLCLAILCWAIFGEIWWTQYIHSFRKYFCSVWPQNKKENLSKLIKKEGLGNTAQHWNWSVGSCDKSRNIFADNWKHCPLEQFSKMHTYTWKIQIQIQIQIQSYSTHQMRTHLIGRCRGFLRSSWLPAHFDFKIGSLSYSACSMVHKMPAYRHFVSVFNFFLLGACIFCLSIAFII